jgi:ABC-type uncharacterized transport system substrate-binding protein
MHTRRTLLRCIRTCALISCCLILATWDARDAFAGEGPTQRDRVYRIGYLEGGPLWRYNTLFEALRASLVRDGWERRIQFPPDAHLGGSWDNSFQSEPTRKAVELMRRTDLDLIIAMGTQAALALLAANNGRTPIVGMEISDPIGSRLVRDERDSGTANFTTAVIPNHWINMFRVFHSLMNFKKLGILHENTVTGEAYSNVNDAREVARERGFTLVEDTTIAETASPAQCLEGIKRLIGRGIDAFYVSAQRCFDWNGGDPRRLLRQLNTAKIATFAREGTPVVQLGALMGASTFDLNRIGSFHAGQIAAILGGKRPSSLPMVLPMELGLSLNLQTAKEVGVDFPMNVLVAADTIIATTESLEDVRVAHPPEKTEIRLLK